MSTPSIATFDSRVTAMSARWERLRDFVDGTDAVKRKTTRYLKRPPGQRPVAVEGIGTIDPYDDYLDRAKFYGATGRTLNGLLGLLFRKDPVVVVPTWARSLVDDVTRTGTSLQAFLVQVAREVVWVGRCGILVDVPSSGTTGARPYLCLYPTEVIDVPRVRYVGARQLTRLVKLREQDDSEDDVTGVRLTRGEQMRVLRLAADPVANIEAPLGWYQQEVWRPVTDPSQPGATKWVLVDTVRPERRGEGLGWIPFVVLGAATDEPTEISKPPLLDLADVNLSHFRKSADYEQGLHVCGVPTPIAAGFPLTSQLTVGATEAWISDNPNARASWMEFTGQGLTPLRQALEDDKAEMAVLGARLLRPERTGMETAEAARIGQAGDAAVLTELAGHISRGVSEALAMAAWWMRPGTRLEDVRAEVGVQLNRDFLPEQMSTQELVQLWTVWQGGGISTDAYLWNLQQGERIPPGRTLEQERAALSPPSAVDAVDDLADPTAA